MNTLINSPQMKSMTSLEIAELVEKRHDNVKRTIESLVAQGVIVQPQIEDEQTTDAMNRHRVTQVYVFTGEQGKRDSIVVVAQLCPEFTARLVDRWQELEAGVVQQKNMLEVWNDPTTIRLIADKIEENNRLTSQLAIAAPKAQALDLISNATGLHGIREAAKTLKITQSQLTTLLVQRNWMYRDGRNVLQGYANRIEQGYIQHVMSAPVQDKIGVDHVYSSANTAKGMARLAQILAKVAA